MNAPYPLRFVGVVALLVLLGVPALVVAQPAPLQQYVQDYAMDSGRHDGQAGRYATVFTHTVRVPGAPWLRLAFSEADLGAGSYLTVTSVLDGAQQRLDATSLAEWYNTSAYFNGDAVEVALHVAPGDTGVYVRLDEVFVGIDAPPESQCGPTDDRQRSNDARVGRILSVGCTGWLIHEGVANPGFDQIVSAGHCLPSGATTLQFNVPSSTAGGGLQHPPPEDQYSVNAASRVFVNGGIGNDWGVFRVFDNANTGQQPSERQGAIFTLAQDLTPPNIRITGYGVDTGVDNQTQQTHVGPNAGSSGTTMRYQVDTTGGNSGSPVIDEANNRSVGVHTHGGCTTAGTGSNAGTSFFSTAFWNAVGTPPPPTADACFTTLNGALTANLDVDDASDIFSGVGSGATTYQVSGTRGTTNRTIRHHSISFANPAAGNDPGCGDGGGVVDWLTFNGLVSGSAPTYNWTGSWRNSCGSTAATTGTISLGACPAPRLSAESEAQRVPQEPLRAEGPVSDDAPLLAAVPEAGGAYCLTDGFGFVHDGEVHDPTDILFGTGDVGDPFDWYVHGGRGTTNGRTLRHHGWMWQNPDADNDPGCGDGAGGTDWFTYNGSVSGGGGGSYDYSGVWLNSCGSTGAVTATITLGACPSPRASAPAASGPHRTAPAEEASAVAASVGVAVASGPNPFTTSTTINFALAEPQHVRLAVYDVLGREVAVLVDEAREAGTHAVVFEAGTLPAGTYLYRVEAGSHMAVKAMTLVR